ncbi:MAG: transporter [Spirochaetes bacterium]|nr:transporter [Spirochaetota bacterium]
MFYKILLFIGVLLNVLAQIILKIGMKKIDLSTYTNLLNKVKVVVINPFLLSSLFFYGVSFIVYSIVLTKMELSKAYPISSISAILFILIISVIFLTESLSIMKILGIVFCIIGIIFIFR